MNSRFHAVALPPASLRLPVALARLVPWAEALRELIVRSARRRAK